MPVKEPGPTVVTTASSASKVKAASDMTAWIIGTNAVACPRSIARDRWARMMPSESTAALHEAPEQSNAKILRISARPTAWLLTSSINVSDHALSRSYLWLEPMLVEIAEADHDLVIDIVYATERNFTGRPIYRRPGCYLHKDAASALFRAMDLVKPLGLRLKIFDTFRPAEAQWRLWNFRPDPEFLADPRRGSPHSRGVAVDLTLIDAEGRELDMGTGFDAFTPLSHHGVTTIPVEAQQNRLLLMGIMTTAGWDFFRNEWWHYQLFDARRYPLLSDTVLDGPMLSER
jgi:D-alanyl-D-alanine dipeptidase